MNGKQLFSCPVSRVQDSTEGKREWRLWYRVLGRTQADITWQMTCAHGKMGERCGAAGFHKVGEMGGPRILCAAQGDRGSPAQAAQICTQSVGGPEQARCGGPVGLRTRLSLRQPALHTFFKPPAEWPRSLPSGATFLRCRLQFLPRPNEDGLRCLI